MIGRVLYELRYPALVSQKIHKPVYPFQIIVKKTQISIILLTLNLTTMNSIPIIFQCVFSDEQFTQLREIKDELTDSIIELNDISVGNPRLLKLNLPFLLLDFKEMISYRNCRGYKWNSYILTLLICKLDYIVATVKESADLNSINLVDNYNNIVSSLKFIKSDCYNSYQSHLM
jgi:hypothetical protein